jgi:transmembrane sensor
MMRNSHEALEEAAAWVARLDAPDCADADREQFERWRKDSGHDRAYATARRLDERLRRLPAYDPRVARLAERALRAPPTPSQAGSRLGRPGVWALAASVTAVAVLAALKLTNRTLPLVPAVSVPYESAGTEVATVTLKDGSIVHLDVDSRIEVSLSARARVVKLQRGRAYFAVTHDPARSFVVEAGEGRMTDVGTRFQAERVPGAEERVTVTLAEGALDVAAHGATPGTLRVEHMHVGEQLSYSDDAVVWLKRTVDPEAATSWTRGRLIFRDLSLSDAVEAVNRYASRKVRLADPSIGKLTVSGTFVLGDSVGFAAALSEAFPVRMLTNPRGEILLAARSEKSLSLASHP